MWKTIGSFVSFFVLFFFFVNIIQQGYLQKCELEAKEPEGMGQD